jgi:hypothetical protein
VYDIGTWVSYLRIKPGIDILGDAVGIKEVHTLKSRGLTGDYYRSRKYLTNPCSGKGKYVKEKYQRSVNVGGSYHPIFTGTDLLDYFKSIDSVIALFKTLKF